MNGACFVFREVRYTCLEVMQWVRLFQNSNLGYTHARFNNFYQVTTTGFYYIGSKDGLHCFLCFFSGDIGAGVSYSDYFSVAFGGFKYEF